MIKILIGEAFIELKTDGRQLIAGLSGAEKQVIASTNAMSQKLATVGKTMTVAGAAITGALALIIKKTVDAGDKFNDMSLRTGESVENLSALAYAAEQSGTNIEGLETGIKFLTRAMADTATGTGTAKDTFTKLGIAVKDTEGKLRPTVDVMKEIATKISEMKNPAEQAATAMQLFGARSGTELVPLLKEGGKGIDELMKKAEELGIVISTKDAKAADEFKDKMNDLGASLAAAGRDIANILIPPLKDLIEWATEIIKKVRTWADAHKPLVEWIVKVGAALGALAAVGGPILLAVSAFLKLVPAIMAVKAALLALGTISTGPIGLLILAVGGLYTAWQTNLFGMKDIVKNAFDDIGGNFSKGAEIIKDSGAAVGAFAEKNEELATSFDNIETGAGKASEAIKIYAGDVAENYNELAIKATESWADFYAFWEAEAKRTADVIDKKVTILIDKWGVSHKVWTDKIKEITKTLYEVIDAQGKIIGLRSQQIMSQIEAAAGVTLKAITSTAVDASKVIEGTIEESTKKFSNYIKKIKNEVGKVTGVILPGGGTITVAGTPVIPYAGPIPSLQTGGIVPKTGLYQLHQWEKVTPANQNTYDQRQSFSPVISISIAGDADERKIKRVVDLALEESARQFRRSGFELVPGRG